MCLSSKFLPVMADFTSALLNLRTHAFGVFSCVLRVMLCVYLLEPLVRNTTAAYISHNHQHNFSCVDWRQAPEAAVGNCTKYGGNGALRCYGGMNNLATIPESKVRKSEEIILCGWPSRSFNPHTDLEAFPRIRSLVIEYSEFTEIEHDFPEMFYLQSINISWTNLSHINARTFKRVHTLKVADLRWNQLMQLDGPLALPRDFEQLYLAGNPWNCTRNFKWLLIPEKGQHVVDREHLICTDRKYKERRMLLVMNYKVILRNECQSHPDLRNCSCSMHHIIPKSHMPLYTVNCSSMQFHSLPAYLPDNTTMFFANDNMITDVLPMRTNVHYRNVVDMHLDNNLIESIDVLEAGYWLQRFRLLSLRGNRLKKIPVYALDDALEDNANANLLLLSMNPWHCTCKFAMRFREILIKYNAILRDSANITCTYYHGEEFKHLNVLAITRHDVCKPNEDPSIYPLDILNGILAMLIVIVLSKFAYDYYQYKYYGRVPWIVMKLP